MAQKAACLYFLNVQSAWLYHFGRLVVVLPVNNWVLKITVSIIFIVSNSP